MLEKIVLFPTETRDSLQQILLSLNQLVDHHFLRFRTTTQVIRELLRKSVANRKEIVKEFGSLDPSATLGKGRKRCLVEPLQKKKRLLEKSGTKADR